MIHLWQFILFITGSDQGPMYTFWSGFGGDLGLLGSLGVLIWRLEVHHRERRRQHREMMQNLGKR